MDILEKIDMYVNEGELVGDNQLIKENDYQKFVSKKLKEKGTSLGKMDDKETKEFFAMIKKEWKG